MSDQNERAFVDWLRATVADPTDADDFHVVSQELLVRLDTTEATASAVIATLRMERDEARVKVATLEVMLKAAERLRAVSPPALAVTNTKALQLVPLAEWKAFCDTLDELK